MYSDPEKRIAKIELADEDKAMNQLFEWVKTGVIKKREFKSLFGLVTNKRVGRTRQPLIYALERVRDEEFAGSCRAIARDALERNKQ